MVKCYDVANLNDIEILVGWTNEELSSEPLSVVIGPFSTVKLCSDSIPSLLTENVEFIVFENGVCVDQICQQVSTTTTISPITTTTTLACNCRKFYWTIGTQPSNNARIIYLDCDGNQRDIYLKGNSGTICGKQIISQIGIRVIDKGCCCDCYLITNTGEVNQSITLKDCLTGALSYYTLRPGKRLQRCSSIAPKDSVNLDVIRLNSCTYDGQSNQYVCFPTPTPTPTPIVTTTTTVVQIVCQQCYLADITISSIDMNSPYNYANVVEFRYFDCNGVSQVNFYSFTNTLTDTVCICTNSPMGNPLYELVYFDNLYNRYDAINSTVVITTNECFSSTTTTTTIPSTTTTTTIPSTTTTTTQGPLGCTCKNYSWESTVGEVDIMVDVIVCSGASTQIQLTGTSGVIENVAFVFPPSEITVQELSCECHCYTLINTGDSVEFVTVEICETYQTYVVDLQIGETKQICSTAYPSPNNIEKVQITDMGPCDFLNGFYNCP